MRRWRGPLRTFLGLVAREMIRAGLPNVPARAALWPNPVVDAALMGCAHRAWGISDGWRRLPWQTWAPTRRALRPAGAHDL